MMNVTGHPGFHYTLEQLETLYATIGSDLCEEWQERAAILQFDGGMSPLAAVNQAHEEITRRLIRRISAMAKQDGDLEQIERDETERLSDGRPWMIDPVGWAMSHGYQGAKIPDLSQTPEADRQAVVTIWAHELNDWMKTKGFTHGDNDDQ